MSEAESPYRYEDLFDIENRPGSGVRLWGKAVEDQVRRVVAAGNQHRQNHAPDDMEIPEAERLAHDPEAERRLHTEVYFLALAVRRVLLFHEAIADEIADPRLEAAQERFVRTAPQAKDFRDFFEHLDEYLLGRGRAQQSGRIAARVSPVLELRWDCANVVVRFGDETLDITAAGEAAARLATDTATAWREHLDAAKEQRLAPPDDCGPSIVETTFSVSTVIGGEDEGPQQFTGVLLDVNVRPARPDEIESDSSG